jgi:hypothetical protein
MRILNYTAIREGDNISRYNVTIRIKEGVGNKEIEDRVNEFRQLVVVIAARYYNGRKRTSK